MDFKGKTAVITGGANGIGKWSAEDNEQHPVKRIGSPRDIAKIAMFLCSEDSGFITGENVTIDGGMSRLMVYHNDRG